MYIMLNVFCLSYSAAVSLERLARQLLTPWWTLLGQDGLWYVVNMSSSFLRTVSNQTDHSSLKTIFVAAAAMMTPFIILEWKHGMKWRQARAARIKNAALKAEQTKKGQKGTSASSHTGLACGCEEEWKGIIKRRLYFRVPAVPLSHYLVFTSTDPSARQSWGGWWFYFPGL